MRYHWLDYQPSYCQSFWSLIVVRFFAYSSNPVEGSHLHLVWTSYRRTLSAAFEEMKKREPYASMKPLFCDFGPGDSDLRRLDKLGY